MTNLMEYFKATRAMLSEMGKKQFSLLPRSPFRPGYIKLDAKVLRRIGYEGELLAMIDLNYFGLQNRAVELAAGKVSIESDGVSVSVSFGNDDGQVEPQVGEVIDQEEML